MEAVMSSRGKALLAVALLVATSVAAAAQTANTSTPAPAQSQQSEPEPAAPLLKPEAPADWVQLLAYFQVR